jgi:Ca-activated chloride channel family protein
MAIRPQRRVLAALAGAAAIIVALAGCGGTSGESGTDYAPKPGRPEATGPNQANDGSTSTGNDPRSTFAVDVDTASYTYARRQILDGRLPISTDVRPEEFVNAFDQDYEQPAGDGFTVQSDGARLPAEHSTGRSDGRSDGGDLRLMRVGLQTRSEPDETRADATLTFVVDVSGSMAEPGRLDLVKDALHTLVDQLRPTDAVAIVAFSGSATVVRPMTKVRDRAPLHTAIDTLEAGNSTNLEAGLTQGYRSARDGFREGTSNRVIILSDGLANSGSTSSDQILATVRDQAAKQIALLGVGVGSEYGDSLMERLADGGDGFVVYVSDQKQARDVFVHRLPASLAVRALDAKVQVVFDPRTVTSYRLIGYENRAVADNQFRNDAVDGGEVGPGHSVTALYEVRLAEGAGGNAQAARVDVRWLNPADREVAEASRAVRVSDLDGAFASASPRLAVDYCAGYLAEVLRGNPAGAYVKLPDLERIARSAAGSTDDADVADLANLIARANALRR